MKLVELLARELDVWPDNAEWVVQEGDNELYSARGVKPVYSGMLSWRDGDYGDGEYFQKTDPETLAEDWKTAIITRADWQAERERIAGGWIAWGGGECPVLRGTKVDVRYRNGMDVMNCVALTYESESIYCAKDWSHNGSQRDIIAYRPHKPEQASAEAIEAGIAAADAGQVKPIEEVKAMYEYNPIHTRNRILEIDRTTEALEEERVQLVQRLADEGFVLLPALGHSEPVEDMSDWRNWEAGDMLIVEDNVDDTHEFKAGELVKLLRHDENHGESAPHCESNDADWWVLAENLKFHSRPTA